VAFKNIYNPKKKKQLQNYFLIHFNNSKTSIAIKNAKETKAKTTQRKPKKLERTLSLEITTAYNIQEIRNNKTKTTKFFITKLSLYLENILSILD